MNKTEQKAFDWLVKHGIISGEVDIISSTKKRGEPDFVLKDGRQYEVKRLDRGGIWFTPKQLTEFKKVNPIILVFSDNGENPIAVAPFSGISKRFKIRVSSSEGKSIWVSDSDYEVLMQIKIALEKVYKKDISISQVISSLIEATSIPTIPAEKDEEIIKKLKVLRNIAKRRVAA